MNTASRSLFGLGFALFWSAAFVQAQDYKNSIASTDIDFIHETDPSTFENMEFVARRKCEMPDKRHDDRPLVQPAFVFAASFSDGTKVELNIDAAFDTRESAEVEARRYVPRLGKLPTTLRKGVRRLVVHQGGRDTTAFSDQGLIVVYSDNATKRISSNDLEETIFHESVHAAWDKRYAKSEAWQRAQAQDGGFVTIYARENPAGEDLAESALFAYTLIHHPDRIPAAEAKKIKKAIPARIRFVADLIPPDQPVFYQVGQNQKESASSRKSSASKVCRVNLVLPGQLGDVLSNALLQKFKLNEDAVSSFLDSAQSKAGHGKELFQMTAAEFEVEAESLQAAVLEYLHCNCDHGDDPDGDQRVKQLMDDWIEQR